MAASHRAAAAVLLIASVLAAVAMSGADARPAVRPDKTAAALSGADDDVRRTGDNTKLTVSSDEHGPGYVAAAVPAEDELVKPNCGDGGEDEDPDEEEPGEEIPHHPSVPEEGGHNGHRPGPSGSGNHSDDPENPETESEESELGQELCSDCEEPKKPKPEQPCNSCEPEPKQLTCNKVRAVREDDTCYSVGQCAGVGQDDLLRFNPNLCCDNLFVGQWLCVDATSPCAD